MRPHYDAAMRLFRVLVAAIAVVIVSALVAPGIGQAQPLPEHSLVITKIVEGDVPAGSTFEVEVECTFLFDNAPEGGFDPTQTVTFGEEGGSETILVPITVDECTATETEDAGAESVVYGGEDNGCDITATETDVSADFPDLNNNSSAPEGLLVTCEVTVTNTFPTEEPPPPAPEPAAQVVVVTPTFTG